MLIKCHACGRVIHAPVYGNDRRPYGPVCAIKKGFANVAKVTTIKNPKSYDAKRSLKVRNRKWFNADDQLDLFINDQKLRGSA